MRGTTITTLALLVTALPVGALVALVLAVVLPARVEPRSAARLGIVGMSGAALGVLLALTGADALMLLGLALVVASVGALCAWVFWAVRRQRFLAAR